MAGDSKRRAGPFSMVYAPWAGAWARAGLSGREHDVMLALCERLEFDGEGGAASWYPRAELAERLGCSADSVTYAVKRLRAHGFTEHQEQGPPRGRRALYVSLEMDWAQCRSRCLSLLSREADGLTTFRWADVPMMGRRLARSIRNGREACGDDSCVADLLRADPVAAANAFMESQCAGLAIADADGLHDVAALTEAAWEARRAGMGLMVVDYLQQLDCQGTGTEYDRVSAVSKALTRLAHSLGVPVLVLASMNRTSADKEIPDMHGFRGSGGIEYDAETAMVLRKGRAESIEGGDRLVELHVVKNRHGIQTEGSPIELFFDGAHNRFEAAR